MTKKILKYTLSLILEIIELTISMTIALILVAMVLNYLYGK